MYKKSKIKTIVGLAFVAVCLAFSVISVYWIAQDCQKSLGQRVELAGVEFSYNAELYEVTAKSEAEFAASWTMTEDNKGDYYYTQFNALLPDRCYRYNGLYATIGGENIKSVVFVIGSAVHHVDMTEGGKIDVIFAVEDWGETPHLFIFVDTYGAATYNATSDSPKGFTLYNLGFAR